MAVSSRSIAASCRAGAGNGEAIRTFIDLPPEADIVAMFVHLPGRKLLLAATSGHGFVTGEDDAMAHDQRSGKQVMNVKPGVEAAVCAFVDGDHVAVVGENRKLLIFPLGRSARNGARAGRLFCSATRTAILLDACAFTWKEGLKDAEQPHLDAGRTERLERRARAGGAAGAPRLREKWEVRVTETRRD